MVLNEGGGQPSTTLFKAEKRQSHQKKEPKDLLKDGKYVTTGGLESKVAKYNDSRKLVNVKSK